MISTTRILFVCLYNYVVCVCVCVLDLAGQQSNFTTITIVQEHIMIVNKYCTVPQPQCVCACVYCCVCVCVCERVYVCLHFCVCASMHVYMPPALPEHQNHPITVKFPPWRIHVHLHTIVDQIRNPLSSYIALLIWLLHDVFAVAAYQLLLCIYVQR